MLTRRASSGSRLRFAPSFISRVNRCVTSTCSTSMLPGSAGSGSIDHRRTYIVPAGGTGLRQADCPVLFEEVAEARGVLPERVGRGSGKARVASAAVQDCRSPTSNCATAPFCRSRARSPASSSSHCLFAFVDIANNCARAASATVDDRRCHEHFEQRESSLRTHDGYIATRAPLDGCASDRIFIRDPDKGATRSPKSSQAWMHRGAVSWQKLRACDDRFQRVQNCQRLFGRAHAAIVPSVCTSRLLRTTEAFQGLLHSA